MTKKGKKELLDRLDKLINKDGYKSCVFYKIFSAPTEKLAKDYTEKWEKGIKEMIFKGLLYTRNEKIIAMNDGEWHHDLDPKLEKELRNMVKL